MKDKDNKENVNDNKSDKITDFSEVVKRSKEIKDNEEIRKKEVQSSLYGNNPMIDLLDKMGIDINDQGIQNLFKELDMEDLVNMIQSGNPSMESIYQLMDKLASAEQKFKQEKEMYRTFFQWVAYRKPYDLASLYQIEAIRNLAEFAGVTVEKLDSKNDIIQKIIPNLKSNLVELLKSIDNSVMLYLGRIIYSDGKFLVEKPLSETQEMQVDFFQSKCFIARVNDNGNHYLVIPKEIFEIMQEIDFNQISKYNQLNERINRTIIAFANAYGAYPKKLVVESILENEKNLVDFIQEETLEDYIEKIIQFSFSNSVVKPSLYMNIVTSQDYINHGLIEFTKSLIDIQNENISEYKHLTEEEIDKKGKVFYYEDSIYLTQLLEILAEKNKNIHSQEAEQIKNQIYVFSLLEFEPNLILQILEMRYQMPESTQYHKFLEIFRNYYKNGEKWILKGYTSFEANSKDARQQNEDYDVSKIVRIDFPKND